jgi:cyclophilin family peptidyl-prolyl cis-trans isomerase
MTKLLRALFVPVLGFATLLPAQDDKAKGQEPKAQEPKAQEPKAEAKPEAKPAPAADDAATAADKAVKAVDAFLAEKKLDKSNARWRNLLPKFPALEFDANSDYFWHMETDAGAVKIRFYADTAPNHVANGIYLARAGFYDGLTFHRIIPGFMAQGGCPNGDGRGNPGYAFAGEFNGSRKHAGPGMLSMANAGPGTDGSQFFITFLPTPHLDGRHTLWGEVADGKDVLKALEGKGSQANNGMLDKGKQVKIARTWISVAPKAAKAEASKPVEKAPEAPKEADKK